MNTKTIVLAVVAMLGTSMACAQYVGADAMRFNTKTSSANLSSTSTVKQVLDSAYDDQMVVLQGHLVGQVGEELYRFADSTGEILVEIDREDFRGLKVDEKHLVKLYGEFDRNYGHKADKLEVEWVDVVQ